MLWRRINLLLRRKMLKSCSSAITLNSFINDKGILRVGGAKSANEIQHPVLLWKFCRIAELVVRWCQEQIAYAGQSIAMNQIRSSSFWMARCNLLVKCIIFKCVRCIQLRRKIQQQKWPIFPRTEYARNNYLRIVRLTSMVLCIHVYQAGPQILSLYTIGTLIH